MDELTNENPQPDEEKHEGTDGPEEVTPEASEDTAAEPPVAEAEPAAAEPVTPQVVVEPAESTEPVTTPPAAVPAPERRSSGGAGVIVAALLIAVIVGGAAGLGSAFVASSLFSSSTTQQSVSETTTTGTTGDPVVTAAAKARASVVYIEVTEDTTATVDLPDTHPTVPVTASGSGVVYGATGDGGSYIVTNDHVASGATRIVVTDSTGESYDAEVVGTDPESDVAVIKVDVELPAITLGDSENLEIGETVVVIGSPFGLQHSVTAGIVSAIHRSLPDSISENSRYPLVDVIQTDASINPGNSGGALLDQNGDLVGIPTAIYSDTGSYDGVGFAVPVRTVTAVADQLIGSGKAEHAFLGIVGTTVTESTADEMGLTVTEGALVVEITPDTGAEKAGLQADDVIVSLDGEKIRSMDDLILAVKRRNVGDEVTVEFYRDGELTELSMTLGVKPDNL